MTTTTSTGKPGGPEARMHTLASLKSVRSSEPGPQRPMTHSEVTYLIKKKPFAPSDGVPRYGGGGDRPELLSAIGQLLTMPRLAVRSFRGKVEEARSWHLRFDSVRVPLDIQRYNVTMAPWWTCDVLPINTSSRDGLLEVCSNVDEWRTRSGKSTSPVLCDVNLY